MVIQEGKQVRGVFIFAILIKDPFDAAPFFSFAENVVQLEVQRIIQHAPHVIHDRGVFIHRTGKGFAKAVLSGMGFVERQILRRNFNYSIHAGAGKAIAEPAAVIRLVPVCGHQCGPAFRIFLRQIVQSAKAVILCFLRICKVADVWRVMIPGRIVKRRSGLIIGRFIGRRRVFQIIGRMVELRINDDFQLQRIRSGHKRA